MAQQRPPTSGGTQPPHAMGAMSASARQDPQRAATWAPEWFDDAWREAQQDGSAARRREILFAVCCAESYLFEWVRDQVLQRDHYATDDDYYRVLNNYFPLGHKRDIGKRWKDVVECLHSDHLIKAMPDFNSTIWHNFRDLVDYRNGLTHSGSSRPVSDQLLHQSRAAPFIHDLDSLPPGAALQAVTELIQALHQAVGTTPPAWLTITAEFRQ